MRNRTDMLAVADSFADSGFMVVAIDLPLHGLTDPTSPLYASGANPLYSGLSLPGTGSIERTFDLDVLNNTTGAAGPDGQIDSSGANFINLASLLTTRDNLREGAADLITLTRSLPNLSLATGLQEILIRPVFTTWATLSELSSAVFTWEWLRRRRSVPRHWRCRAEGSRVCFATRLRLGRGSLRGFPHRG